MPKQAPVSSTEDDQNIEQLASKKLTDKQRIERLEEHVDRLTRCFEKVATYAGQGNTLPEFKFTRYLANRKDMSRFKN